MTLEQPRLGSDPPRGSGRERGATSLELFYCTFALRDMFVYYHIGFFLIVLFSL